jgi:hypothetical protein
MKFQGMARPENGPENGPIAPASAASFFFSAEAVFSQFPRQQGGRGMRGFERQTATRRVPEV